VPAAFKSFCIDGLQSVAPGTNSFAEVRPLAASSLLGTTRAGLLADFWRQYGPADAAGFADKTDSAAFQLAVWEIINDGLPVGTRLASDLATGQFSVAAAGRTMPAALRAAQWLAGFDTTAPGKTAVALHALQDPTRQDQVVCVPTIDLDVDSDNTGTVSRSSFEEAIEQAADKPGVIVPVGGDRAKMIVDVPQGMTATLAFDAGAAGRVKVFSSAGTVVLQQGRLSTPIVGGGSPQPFWRPAPAWPTSPSRSRPRALEPHRATRSSPPLWRWIWTLTATTTARSILTTARLGGMTGSKPMRRKAWCCRCTPVTQTVTASWIPRISMALPDVRSCL
jgi:hypothetical protein